MGNTSSSVLKSPGMQMRTRAEFEPGAALTEGSPYAKSNALLAKVQATYSLLAEVARDLHGADIAPTPGLSDDTVGRRWLDDLHAQTRGVSLFGFTSFAPVTRALDPASSRAWQSGAEIIAADAPATPWTVTHSQLFDDVLNPSDADIRLSGATATEISGIKDAVKLLDAVVPDLSAAVLPHTSFIFLVDGADAFESASDRRLPRAVYLNRDMSGDVVRTAEALLHESTHQKLYDLQLLYTLYGAAYDPVSAPTIRPPWHPPDAQWSIDRATAASHVYVHLTFFFERLRESIPAGCDPEAISRSATQARSRADSLLSALTPHHFTQFNTHGRAFLSWLRQAHQHTSTTLQEGPQ